MFKIAKNIKIGVKLDKSGFQKELNQLLKKGYDLNLNSGNFKSVINDINTELNKLRNTLSNINGDAFNSTVGGVKQTKNEVESLANSMSKIEKMRFNLQNKLNTARSNSFIDTSVIDNLQKKLNTINTNTPEKEILELKTAINNLGSSDRGIVRLQNAVTRLQERISTIKKNKIDIVDASDIKELKQAENEVVNLKRLLGELKAGDVIDGKKISASINTATNSVRTLENEFKNVNTTASGLATTMKNIFSYAFGGSAIYAAMNSMRAAVNTTIELDTAMRDLRRVSDETESTYNNFMQTANETAIALGTTTAGAIEATTTFKQLGYSFKESSEYMSQMAMILSNVGNMSASDAASSLVSILKGFRMEAEETTRIVDVLNEAGNRFALTTGDLTEGLRIGGASLAVANNDLEQASSLIIAGTEILRDSNLVANGLKTISMRLRGVSSDGEELNAKMGEFIKNLTGVDLTNVNGEFRSTYDVLKDIGEVWDTLNSKEQAILAEEIAGKTRANIFTSIMQNANQLEKAYDTLKDSAGSAAKEQEAYMDSLEGKINALKESLTEISMKVIDSNFMKGLIEGITSGVNAVGKFIDTFGAIPTTVTAVVTALTVFNSKFRENAQILTSSVPLIGKWQSSLLSTEKTLKSQINSIKANITQLKSYETGYSEAGLSTKGFGKNLLSLNGQLALTTTGLIATKAATIALQSAMSMGLSLAITACISGITSLVNNMKPLSDRMDEITEKSNTLNDSLNKISDLGVNLNAYSSIVKQLKDANLAEEERVKLNERLDAIKSNLIGIDSDYEGIINNQNISLESQLSLMQRIADLKVKDQAKELEKSMGWQMLADNSLNAVKKNVAEYQEMQEAMANSTNGSARYKDTSYSIENLQKKMDKAKDSILENSVAVEQWNNDLKTLKDVGYSTNKTMLEYDDTLKAMVDDILNISDSTGSASNSLNNLKESANNAAEGAGNVSEALTDLNYDGVIDATDHMLKLAETSDDSKRAIENLGDAFSQLEGPIGVLEKAIEEFKEYGMVSDKTWSNIITSGNSEMIALLADNETFLKNAEQLYGNLKTQQEELAQQTIRRAQEEINASNLVVDATNSEIAANENLANTKNNITSDSVQKRANMESVLVSTNAKNYSADESNHTNKENYKIKGSMQSANARINNEKTVTDKANENYTIDGKNNIDVLNSKLKANDEFTNGVISNAKTTTDQLNSNYRTDAENYKNYINSKIAAIRKQAEAESELKRGTLGFAEESQKVIEAMNAFKNAANAADAVNSYVGSNGVGTMVGNGSVGHGNIGSSGSGSSGGSNSSTEKEIADISLKVDWYYRLNDAISDYNNLLKENQEKQKHATGKERIDLIKEEIELNKKLANSKQNLIDEYQKEANQLQKDLKWWGFEFDANNNLINSAERLLELKKQANSLSGEEKKNMIDRVNDIEDMINRFGDLTNNEIPSLLNGIADINNSIKDLYKDQLDIIADTEKEIYDVIEYYATKTKDAKVKAIDEQIEALEKLYSLEDREDELIEKQNNLADIKNQMDLYEGRNDSASKAKYDQLKKEYDELLKDMNLTIRDNQKDAITDSLEAQKEQLDKDLEEFLKPENINTLIADAMKNGYIQLGDEVLDLNTATSQYLAETTVGTQNLINANTELLNSYLSVKEVLKDISTLNANLGNIGIDLNTVYSGMSRSNVGNSVSFGDITVQIQGSTNMSQTDITAAVQKALVNVSNNLKF